MTVRSAIRELSWSQNQVHNLILATMGATALALLAQVRVPMPGTLAPFTMQVFAVIMLGCLFGPRLAVAAVAEYLLLGICGLPVFSQLTSGFVTATGVTGGYMFGFLFAAAICGAIYARYSAGSYARRLTGAVLAGLAGVVVIYLPGWAWYAAYTHMGMGNALTQAVIPFVIPDILKVSLAATLLALRRKGAA